MPGNPQRTIRRITNLVEWFKEFSNDFDAVLPSIYRFNGTTSTGDARRDAWADADHRLIVMTGAALTTLDGVLRSAAIQRAKPRGQPSTYVKVEADAGVDERIGAPMYSDE